MIWTAPDTRDWTNTHGGNYTPEGLAALDREVTETDSLPGSPVPDELLSRIRGAHDAGHAWCVSRSRYPTSGGVWELVVFDGEQPDKHVWPPGALAYYVCAATVADAHAWADHHQVPRKHVIPVTPRTLRHTHSAGAGFAVVRERTFFDLPDRDQDRANALMRRLEYKRPRTRERPDRGTPNDLNDRGCGSSVNVDGRAHHPL